MCVVLAVAGCTPSVPLPAPSVSPPAVSATPAAVRRCETATTIGGAVAPSSLPATGEVTFLPLDYSFGAPIDGRRGPDDSGFSYFKVPVRLRSGAEATVSVPAAYRDRAKLTYHDRNPHTVSFRACGSAGGATHSDFAGGFAVRPPVCLPVDVTSDGRSIRVRLEFGVGAC
ncbi:hypothetical protein O7635_19220 [Asanoa sp. WMMD1127]|uniref:hypothetical protein n=1 Tax=Asanoa sp. WMMD1127 TaxID=3016107 RepID=UPI002417E2CE|nr:hypothetical protein [Asanoa sp. WMMD1127]MDG4823991.1 hypothetical protein [Asanoa sp. WMMD1127]